MDHIDLEIFLTIVRAKSISRAAEALFLSPSAVGSRLKSLEDELGFSLLLRRKGYKSIQLTEKGSAFLPYAEQWLYLWKQSLLLKDAPDTPRFSLGCSSTLLHFSAGLYREFRKEHPSLRLDINILDSEVAYALVQQNKLDLGLVMYPQQTSGLVTEELMKEPLVISFSPSYETAADTPVSIHDFPPEHQILFLWNNGFEEWYTHHIPYYSGGILRVNSAQILTELFDPSCSWAILPLSIARDLKQSKNIPYSRVRENPPPRPVYLIQNETAKDNPLAKDFYTKLLSYISVFH